MYTHNRSVYAYIYRDWVVSSTAYIPFPFPSLGMSGEYSLPNASNVEIPHSKILMHTKYFVTEKID